MHFLVGNLYDLRSQVKKFKPTNVLSIIDPDVSSADWIFDKHHTFRAFQLRFDDIEKPYMGGTLPSYDHCERIIAHFRERSPTNDRWLVHCHAGISRSTASTWAMMTDFLEGDHVKAFEWLQEIRPQLYPNVLMAEYFDKILKKSGKMIKHLHDWRGEVALMYKEDPLKFLHESVGNKPWRK